MTSVAHIQDWPAVWALKEQGVLPEGTLFAPGHSGDFLAGKQIRPALLKEKGCERITIAKEVWARHYNNTSVKVALRETGLGKAGKPLLWERTLNNVEGWDTSTMAGANNAFDSEFWQEKLSKFLVNSMRVYEYWGYQWWLPFYDRGLVAFWERVPFRWRIGKLLYMAVVEKLQKDVELREPKEKQRFLKQRIRQIISTPVVELLIWRTYGIKKMLRNYMLGIQRAIPQKDFKKYLGEGGNINSYLASLHHKRYIS